ncbi:methylated-DNA--[protein]-cysteine S-methyltransferase [Undibacterium sp. SXout7W]|uniref:methylated-DNA--[protein]-cysteine S-methyltransferase n=1 Tax=Undibacterium sp. SXout7W TaxID=3413049 RepID=UPI003BF10155
MQFTEIDSPLGRLLLAASTQGISGVYFEQHRHFKGSTGWKRRDDHPVLLAASQQLSEYFEGQRQEFTLPLDLSAGTVFQQTVWQALLKIPYASTESYSGLANQIGNPRAVRAVGAANGRNPVSIIVPCHRVIAANGALTGYAGGMQHKQALLNLERR